jgi:hypothetical protein
MYPENRDVSTLPEADVPQELAAALRECVEAGRGHPPAARGCVSDVVPPVDLARVAEWLDGRSK